MIDNTRNAEVLLKWHEWYLQVTPNRCGAESVFMLKLCLILQKTPMSWVSKRAGWFVSIFLQSQTEQYYVTENLNPKCLVLLKVGSEMKCKSKCCTWWVTQWLYRSLRICLPFPLSVPVLVCTALLPPAGNIWVFADSMWGLCCTQLTASG